MTPASNHPNLRKIGQSAFTEVLDTLLSLPATGLDSAGHSPPPSAPDPITSTVGLAGCFDAHIGTNTSGESTKLAYGISESSIDHLAGTQALSQL